MNNNRGSNRRRGRGNNRQQGGNQGNRIDSRARGNAPQLLEKYKKLAHDASLNGDRVQAEYYLQFADHYFRVIADSRAQREEQQQQRPRQQGDRDQPYDREQSSSYDEEFRDEDEQVARAPRESGRDGGRDGNRDSRRERQDNAQREQSARDDASANDAGDEFEPADNPFTRDNNGRGRRQDGGRQGRSGGETASNDDVAEGEPGDESRFDPSSLPPSLSAGDAESKPRRKPRKPRATENDGEELETVN